MMEAEAHVALASTLRALLDQSLAARGSGEGVAATTHATTRVLLSHQHRNRLPTESVDRWDARDEYLRLFSAAASDQGLTLMQLSREPPVASAAEGGFSDTGSVERAPRQRLQVVARPLSDRSTAALPRFVKYAEFITHLTLTPTSWDKRTGTVYFTDTVVFFLNTAQVYRHCMC